MRTDEAPLIASRFTRRQLLRAGAWTAPALVLAASLPAAAAQSGDGSSSGGGVDSLAADFTWATTPAPAGHTGQHLAVLEIDGDGDAGTFSVDLTGTGNAGAGSTLRVSVMFGHPITPAASQTWDTFQLVAGQTFPASTVYYSMPAAAAWGPSLSFDFTYAAPAPTAHSATAFLMLVGSAPAVTWTTLGAPATVFTS